VKYVHLPFIFSAVRKRRGATSSSAVISPSAALIQRSALAWISRVQRKRHAIAVIEAEDQRADEEACERSLLAVVTLIDPG